MVQWEKKIQKQVLTQRVAELLSSGCVVGWHQGRAEFGPRSLGNRSILGDPRIPEMQTTMNLKIKFRESFRPFAPAILEHLKEEYFDISTKSPYMLLVAPVTDAIRDYSNASAKGLFGVDQIKMIRSKIPSVTHVDYSARIQTVDGNFNPKFHELLKAFLN